MVTSNSCPQWKGKFLSFTSSCQDPFSMEFRMMTRWSTP
uniref:Uncharacterized protein n=1 Tax=Anguilla anguilla TaxID=7936 RepID=A0A0E9XYI5_ANGAN